MANNEWLSDPVTLLERFATLNIQRGIVHLTRPNCKQSVTHPELLWSSLGFTFFFFFFGFTFFGIQRICKCKQLPLDCNLLCTQLLKADNRIWTIKLDDYFFQFCFVKGWCSFCRSSTSGDTSLKCFLEREKTKEKGASYRAFTTPNPLSLRLALKKKIERRLSKNNLKTGVVPVRYLDIWSEWQVVR